MPAEIHCPRCGYDMRTATAHWTESCPVDGTCSECGLVFHWVEVLQPERFVPWWWPEGTSHGRWIRRALVTWFMALRPRRFWEAAQMTTRPRPWRLVGCFLIVQLVLSGLYVAVQGASAARVWLVADSSVLSAMGTGVMPPAPAATEGPTLGAAMLEAITEPFSQQSQLNLPGYSVGSWPAPSELHAHLDDGLRSGWIMVPSESNAVVALVARSIAITMWLQLLMPLLFILLPMTRKKAKVRWRHLGRICACSFYLSMWAVAFTLVAFLAGATVLSARQLVLWPVVGIVQFGLPIWTLIWWTRAIGGYLRMPHAPAVVVGLLTIAALLLLVLMVLVGHDGVVVDGIAQVFSLFS